MLGVRVHNYHPTMQLVSLRASSLGTLVVEREKEGELATTSLEFEYLH